jgi:hypothetical protein
MKLGPEYRNTSVSTGTMREEDLIPVFESILKDQGVKLTGRPIEVNNLLGHRKVSEVGRERISIYLNETLFDLMDSIAPDGCYFGAHPGDGADYGFWEGEE